jgi:hypothetical protein
MANQGNDLGFLFENFDPNMYPAGGMGESMGGEAQPNGQMGGQVPEQQIQNYQGFQATGQAQAYPDASANQQYPAGQFNQPQHQQPATQQPTQQQEPASNDNGFRMSLVGEQTTQAQNPSYMSSGMDSAYPNIILQEINEFYERDEEDPLGEQKEVAKKKAASEFRQLMMTKFPNRYFI